MPTRTRKMDETITIRIDRETRLALDLLARAKGRSVSAVIVSEMRKIASRELPKCKVGDSEVPLATAIWDVYSQDRLVKLALYAPQLLDEEQQKIWRVISEDPAYLPKRDKPNFAAIRNDWKLIQEKVRKYEQASEE